MQIISRRVSQGIVFEGQAAVTVVEIVGTQVTLEITGSDGETERITISAPATETLSEPVEELALATC